MKKSVLKGKLILAVDDEPDVLDVLREELEVYGVRLDTAATYGDAMRKLTSQTYDMAILDIMGVRGFDLLKIATEKDLPVVMLTAHALNPETLRQSIDLGARAYLPKDKLGGVAPFLEDVLTLSYETAWKRTLEKVGWVLGESFGPEWRKTENEFWELVERDLGLGESIIIRR